jgi:hypothetical protein
MSNIITKKSINSLIENNLNPTNRGVVKTELLKIQCTGEDLKSLVGKKLLDFGYSDVRIKFLGYNNENKRELLYIIYTESDLYTFKATSKIEGEIPCMDITEVNLFVENVG